MGYTIEPARAADLPRIQAVEQAAARLFEGWGVLADEEEAPRPLDSYATVLDRGLLWVARAEDGTPVGFAMGGTLSGEAYLREVSVDPEYGRRGIGRRLIETVCEWGHETGYASILLTTFRDIPWNAPMYERLGFQIVDEAHFTADMHAQLAREAAAGLPRHLRVIMRRSLLTQAA